MNPYFWKSTTDLSVLPIKKGTIRALHCLWGELQLQWKHTYCKLPVPASWLHTYSTFKWKDMQWDPNLRLHWNSGFFFQIILFCFFLIKRKLFISRDLAQCLGLYWNLWYWPCKIFCTRKSDFVKSHPFYWSKCSDWWICSKMDHQVFTKNVWSLFLLKCLLSLKHINSCKYF